jgi:glycosyltransferase involved in cell wall biosynthesis
MPKKIVILSQYFPPEMGAPQSRLYETAVGLKQLGWEVIVITAMPNYPTGKIFGPYKGKFSVSDTHEGLNVYRYTLYASNSKKSLPRIISMLSFSITSFCSLFKLLKFRPDYIFTESPPLTLALTGLILAKCTGAKHIMNVSDLWPLSAFELGAISKGFLYKRLESLEQFLYKKSFACVGQSQQIVDALTAKGGRKTHLFRNGVYMNRFESVTLTAAPKSEKLKIVYAGLLGIAQGIYDMCRNIDFHQLNVEFHIYGEGAEKQEIIQYLEAHAHTGIFLHSPVSRNLIPLTIMQYDLTLIPLIKPIYGAVPSKIYEAMAAGLPIIFTGGGEGAEIIKEYNTGWVCDPSDYTAIRSKIKEITLMDKSQLELIKNNCVKAATNVFNRDKQIEKLHLFLLNSLEYRK